MNSQDLNKKLIDAFPNLKEKYTEEILWNDGDIPDSHIVFEDILVPFIRTMIHSNNRETLKAVFDFVEDILLINDEYSNEVIAVSVIEPLVFDEKIKNSFLIALADENTRKIINELVADM